MSPLQSAQDRARCIQEAIEDAEAIDRMAIRVADEQVLREALRASLGDPGADWCMEARLYCKSILVSAMASLESVCVEDGIVVVRGRREQEFTRWLARFNQKSPTRGISLAAFYLEQFRKQK